MGQELARTVTQTSDDARRSAVDLDALSMGSGARLADTKHDSPESVINAVKTNISRKVLKFQQQQIAGKKNLASRLAFFNADKCALYTNQITPRLVKNLGIASADAAEEGCLKALLSEEGLKKLQDYFERVHGIVMDILDPEKNPLFISINKGIDPDEGSKQIVQEVMQMVQNPGYRQELRAGFGATESEPTVVTVGAYTLSRASTQDVYYQRNEQLKKQIIAKVESKIPKSTPEQKSTAIKFIINKEYPNANWDKRDKNDNRFPDELIAIPDMYTLAAGAPGIEINGMDKDKVNQNAEYQLLFSNYLLRKTFPHLESRHRLSKPTMEQFTNRTYHKIVNLITRAISDPNYPYQEQRKIFIDRVNHGMKAAWLRLGGEEEFGPFESSGDENKRIYRQNAIAYEALHAVEAGFENVRLKSELNGASPDSIMKYGAASEKPFNQLQDAIVFCFTQEKDPEISFTNTAGREGGTSKIIGTTVTDSSIAPYYDINDYDPNVSDMTIRQLKEEVQAAADIDPVNKFKIAATKMLEYYKNMPSKYAKDRLSDLLRIGKVIPLDQYVQHLVEFDNNKEKLEILRSHSNG